MPVETLDASHEFLRRLIVYSKAPLPMVANQIDERDGGEMAGAFSRAGTADAIGDEHLVAFLFESGGDCVVAQAGQKGLLEPPQADDQVMVLVDQPRRTAARG